MKKILYLGTDPKHVKTEKEIIHFPVIELVPRSLESVLPILEKLHLFTHLIFTSKNAVSLFFKRISIPLVGKTIFAIGPSTAEALQYEGMTQVIIAEEATQEGLIATLKKNDLSRANILIPRSSIAREPLTEFLKKENYHFEVLDLYDPKTTSKIPPFSWDEIDEVMFTSPSTVRAFFSLFPAVPINLKLKSIGPITEKFLAEWLKKNQPV